MCFSRSLMHSPSIDSKTWLKSAFKDIVEISFHLPNSFSNIDYSKNAEISTLFSGVKG